MTTLDAAQGSSQGASLLQLARLLPKLVSWVPVGVAVTTIFGVFVWRFDTLNNPTEGIVVMRVATVLTALGVAFLLDDASRNVTAPSVVTLRWRMGLRLGLVVAVSTCIVGLAAAVLSTRTDIPGFWWGFVLEAVTLIVLLAAIALVLQNHFGMSEPGHVVAVGLVMSLVLMLVLSARWPMFAMPDAGWTASHQRWAVLAVVAAAVVIYELRDPASRWLSSTLRSVTARR